MSRSDGTRIDLIAHTIKLLKVKPSTTNELVETIGCERGSVERYVRALSDHGLIESSERKTANGRRPIEWRWK